MKLLVFEFSSACKQDNLISEGFYMLKALLNDLEQITCFDTYYLIDKKIDSFSFKNCHPIHLTHNIFEWLDANIEEFDYCFFVAPEDNLIQYKLTKLLENKSVRILGSDSYSSFICSSKYLTYCNIPDNILKIKTLKINLDNVNFEKIKEYMKRFDFIVKPDNRTSSNLIYHIRTKEEFKTVLDIYSENNINEILLQEYLPGEPISVSVLCDDDYINCISVNSQMIENKNNKIEYMGCVTPLNHEYKNRLFSVSKSIVKNIPGLKGFIGIDYIIHEENIFLVEVNARLTTPFIVLQEKCSHNLTESIIKMIVDKKRDKIRFTDKGTFKKRG